LQPRFAERTRKRVFRLMAHPRFRAAYDFLLLRAGESDALRESGEWWTEIQALSPDQISEQLAPRAPTASTGEKPAGSVRRRRRGGRRRKAAAPKTGSPE
jgi:poly(A) polymerase